ncbi:MAG: helix-turn-helix domain-containing protein [Rhizobiaceae bacterium]
MQRATAIRSEATFNIARRPDENSAFPATGGGLQRSLPHARAVEWCDCLIDIAAALFNVSGRELRQPGRSTLDVTRVRQIAMYVGHVVLRLSMSDVGRGFGRDRTTVLHACHLVEDMRDDADFDRVVGTMERVAGAAFRERGRI